MTLALKNIKIHNDMSEETLCFSATLYWNNQKVAIAENTGKGGCNRYHWYDPAVKTAVEHWATQNTESKFEQLDSVVLHLISDWEEQKRLKTMCKNKIVLRLKSNPTNFMCYQQAYNPELKNKLKQIHGNDLIEIINERFL